MSKIYRVSSTLKTKKRKKPYWITFFWQNLPLGEVFFSKKIENSPYSKNAKNRELYGETKFWTFQKLDNSPYSKNAKITNPIGKQNVVLFIG